MPVIFKFIKANTNDHNVFVAWDVASEENIKMYELERSINGTTFEKIGIVNAKGNSLENFYNYIDSRPFSGISYYRIKVIELSGTNNFYSKIVKVSLGKENIKFSVFPNPIENNILNLRLYEGSGGKYFVKLIGTSGQILLTQSYFYNEMEPVKKINLPSGLSSGIYQMQISKEGSILNEIKTIIIAAH